MNVLLALHRPRISHHISSRIAINTQKEDVLAMSINAYIVMMISVYWAVYRRFGYDVVHMAVYH